MSKMLNQLYANRLFKKNNKKYKLLSDVKINGINYEISNEIVFSETFLEEAQKHWMKNQGEYDGKLLGLVDSSIEGGVLRLKLIPMKYSYHKYIHHCLKNKIKLSKKETIYPLCVVGIIKIQTDDGFAYPFGIKKQGMIESGKVETIPQGFVNHTDSKDVILESLKAELKEEYSGKITGCGYNILGIGEDIEYHQFAIFYEIFNLIPAIYTDDINGKEHEHIMHIEEKDLEYFSRYPHQYLNDKHGIILGDSGDELGNMSKAILELIR